MYGSEIRSEVDSKGLVSQLFERSILGGAGVNLLCADAGRGGHDSADDAAACCAGRLLHRSTLLPKEALRYPLSVTWGYNFWQG